MNILYNYIYIYIHLDIDNKSILANQQSISCTEFELIIDSFSNSIVTVSGRVSHLNFLHRFNWQWRQ